MELFERKLDFLLSNIKNNTLKIPSGKNRLENILDILGTDRINGSVFTKLYWKNGDIISKESLLRLFCKSLACNSTDSYNLLLDLELKKHEFDDKTLSAINN